jgi:DNA-binding HxlR family transcriptional regulator/putative sterol carrier protein
MHTRSYNQYCGLAYALDRVGERWTLLIIRELVAGPRRFTDLLAGLPGISTNLLTERLKSLEQHGLIQRRSLPPPAAASVYGLTATGHGLQPMLLELGRWGSQFVPSTPGEDAVLRINSYALTPQTFFRPERAQHLSESYTLVIDGDVQQVHIHMGTIAVQQGALRPAAMALHATMDSYLGLLAGALQAEEALEDGLIRVEGEFTALQRFLTVCGMER